MGWGNTGWGGPWGLDDVGHAIDVVIETVNVLKLIEPWAITREQVIHQEALMRFGEKITARHRWNVEDFEAGRVTRCTTCQPGGSPNLEARYASVYKQAGESYCPDCFGVGFTGGFSPVLYISYALITDQLENWEDSKTGRFTPATPDAQFYWTPHLQEHDMISRFARWDNDTPVGEIDRFTLDEVRPVTLRTGPRKRPPGPPTHGDIGVVDELMIAQACKIMNLPQEHPLWGVVMSP